MVGIKIPTEGEFRLSCQCPNDSYILLPLQSNSTCMDLFEDGVEHGLVVVEGDLSDERPAELVDVAQGHGREVHVQQRCPAMAWQQSIKSDNKLVLPKEYTGSD